MRQPDATTAAQRLFARHRDTVEDYLFIAPFLAIYLIFLIYPFLKGIWISLHEWDLLAVAFNPAAKILIGLVLAVVLNRQTRMMATFRTAFFISQVLSVTVVTLIWQMMFSPRQGLFANIVRSVGLEPASWLTHETLAMAAIVITTVWWSIGFAMEMFLAGLQEIPRDRYEAARLDGAGPWTLFRHFTLPGIRRTTTLVIVFEIILHFQVFGQSHLITQGGPNDRTQVLVRYIYQTAFRDSDLGHASALAVILFLAMLGFSFLQLRLSREPD